MGALIVVNFLDAILFIPCRQRISLKFLLDALNFLIFIRKGIHNLYNSTLTCDKLTNFLMSKVFGSTPHGQSGLSGVLLTMFPHETQREHGPA